MPPLSTAEMDELAADIEALPGFPSSAFSPRGKRAADPSTLIGEVRKLGPADITAHVAHQESGAGVGSAPADLQTLRRTHHRLAQLLAAGMSDTDAARLCSYDVSRVNWLRNHSPAFRELVAYYAKEVDAKFLDFATAAAELSNEVLSELQRRVNESPEKMSDRTLLEAVRTLADRSGNGPTQKNVNVNVNADLGERLSRAQARLRNITPGAAQ